MCCLPPCKLELLFHLSSFYPAASNCVFAKKNETLNQQPTARRKRLFSLIGILSSFFCRRPRASSSIGSLFPFSLPTVLKILTYTVPFVLRNVCAFSVYLLVSARSSTIKHHSPSLAGCFSPRLSFFPSFSCFPSLDNAKNVGCVSYSCCVLSVSLRRFPFSPLLSVPPRHAFSKLCAVSFIALHIIFPIHTFLQEKSLQTDESKIVFPGRKPL